MIRGAERGCGQNAVVVKTLASIIWLVAIRAVNTYSQLMGQDISRCGKKSGHYMREREVVENFYSWSLILRCNQIPPFQSGKNHQISASHSDENNRDGYSPTAVMSANLSRNHNKSTLSPVQKPLSNMQDRNLDLAVPCCAKFAAAPF